MLLASSLRPATPRKATRRRGAEGLIRGIGRAIAEELPCRGERRDPVHDGHANDRVPRLYEQAARPTSRIPGGLGGLAGRCGNWPQRWCRWVTTGVLAGTTPTETLHGAAAPLGRPLPRRAPQAQGSRWRAPVLVPLR